MEWLHQGCDSDLSADFLNFGASNFPFKNPFKKCFKIVFFSLWRRDPSGFGAAIFDAVARSSIVLCNSVSADLIVVAASKLLGAAAACVILLGSLLQLDLANSIGMAASRLRQRLVVVLGSDS